MSKRNNSSQRTARPTEPRPVIAEWTPEAGDHVYVGEFGRVHWIILNAVPAAHRYPELPLVELQSPMSSRTRLACLGELRLHTKGETDD